MALDARSALIAIKPDERSCQFILSRNKTNGARILTWSGASGPPSYSLVLPRPARTGRGVWQAIIALGYKLWCNSCLFFGQSRSVRSIQIYIEKRTLTLSEGERPPASGPPELSLTCRNLTAEAATSHPYSIRVWHFTGPSDPCS
ncbi:hypothetical protein EVAR_56807_1 [Eumeta japonica]|uniref:Uncharacterized protein n=1 Tax=Eumeta variegata TaxID=151549 RepID=A0A4C1Y1J9_EUMVA|nr:hypothetical protein EVAR_56807_1 [Eumeta japonica]